SVMLESVAGVGGAGGARDNGPGCQEREERPRPRTGRTLPRTAGSHRGPPVLPAEPAPGPWAAGAVIGAGRSATSAVAPPGRPQAPSRPARRARRRLAAP